MQQYLAIAAGGAVGALMRFAMSNWVYGVTGRDFPYGTLVVNVAGCLLMGILYVLLLERVAGEVAWRAFLLIGMLGAFTTFSTFSIETLNLLENGAHLRALINVLASVSACLLATWLGVVAARQL